MQETMSMIAAHLMMHSCRGAAVMLSLPVALWKRVLPACTQASGLVKALAVVVVSVWPSSKRCVELALPVLFSMGSVSELCMASVAPSG